MSSFESLSGQYMLSAYNLPLYCLEWTQGQVRMRFVSLPTYKSSAYIGVYLYLNFLNEFQLYLNLYNGNKIWSLY